MNLRRVLVSLCIFFLVFIGTPVLAIDSRPDALLTPSFTDSLEESTPDSKVDLGNQVDLREFRSFLQKIDADVQESLPNFSLSKIFEDLRQGRVDLRPDKVGQAILDFLGREILRSAPLIGKLLILAVLCAVLEQLQVAFNGSIGQMAQVMSYLVLLGIAMASFNVALNVARGAIDQMVGLMQTLFPVMMTLLLAMGNMTTAALFKPIVMGSLTFLATILKTIVLPLFFLTAVLKLFNRISEHFKLSKLVGLVEFVGKFALCFILVVFIGIMSIQGVTGGVADGVALRTAKYSADLIPVVGKFFKDAVELVVTSGLLIKNALGVIAFLAIVFICLGPVVKIVAMLFVFRISAALIEPLGAKALADSLQDMAKSLIFVFGTVASVAIMFFMTVAVVVGSGNLSIMLR